MDILENIEDCTGCYACLNICPRSAITMNFNDNGFSYPEINKELCINCNLCKRTCPIIDSPNKKSSKKEYIAFSKNQKIQFSSSSGGIFQTLATYVINKNGTVFGVGFDQNKTVKHIMVNNLDDLYKIVGTKYVQSEVGFVYREAEKKLLENKLVLFSGTSCQIAGLKKFLKKDYENLITVDLICHGVPSPIVFKKYLNKISNNNLDDIEKINFRKKNSTKNKLMFTIEFKNGEKIEEVYNENLFIKGFINNLYLRPSCFNCHFKGDKRCSDITLGDFWSAKDFYPDFFNINGNSSVIIHTDRGQKIFDEIQGMINFKQSEIQKLATWNKCFFESAEPAKSYEAFLGEYLGTDDIVDLIENCLKKDNLKNASQKHILDKLVSRIKEVFK